MANFKTRAVSKEEFELIIDTIRTGFTLPNGKRVRPNEKVLMCILLESQLGLRQGDICSRLRLCDIVLENGKYRLNYFEEQKTKKSRHFLVPTEVYIFLQDYAIRHNLKPTQKLFNISVRTVQHHVQLTCEYLGIQGVSTHSFRKFFAQTIYENNNYDIMLIKELLQHSNVAITQRYLGVSSQRAEQALKNHIVIPT